MRKHGVATTAQMGTERLGDGGGRQSSQSAGRCWNTPIAICQPPEDRSRREVHNRGAPVGVVFSQRNHLAHDPCRIYAALDCRGFCPERAPASGQYLVGFLLAPGGSGVRYIRDPQRGNARDPQCPPRAVCLDLRRCPWSDCSHELPANSRAAHCAVILGRDQPLQQQSHRRPPHKRNHPTLKSISHKQRSQRSLRQDAADF